MAASLLFFTVTFFVLQCSVVLKRDACHFGKQHGERSPKMYFLKVSIQGPIVLKNFILYVFHILLYTYVCTKLLIHVQSMCFL